MLRYVTLSVAAAVTLHAGQQNDDPDFQTYFKKYFSSPPPVQRGEWYQSQPVGHLSRASEAIRHKQYHVVIEVYQKLGEEDKVRLNQYILNLYYDYQARNEKKAADLLAAFKGHKELCIHP